MNYLAASGAKKFHNFDISGVNYKTFYDCNLGSVIVSLGSSLTSTSILV
jgi:hypothetical protein